MKFSKRAIEIAVRKRRERTTDRSATRRRKHGRPVHHAPNGGATALGDDQEEVTLAICHELARQPFRPTIWAIHEWRDMRMLSRELVQTAEEFSELHLAAEPRAKSALLGDSGGFYGGPHRMLLRRSALVKRIDDLYQVVARKIGAENLSAFAMVFAPSRPSLSDLRHARSRPVQELHRIIETGLTKLWACAPLFPRHEEIHQVIERVNAASVSR